MSIEQNLFIHGYLIYRILCYTCTGTRFVKGPGTLVQEAPGPDLARQGAGTTVTEHEDLAIGFE